METKTSPAAVEEMSVKTMVGEWIATVVDVVGDQLDQVVDSLHTDDKNATTPTVTPAAEP